MNKLSASQRFNLGSDALSVRLLLAKVAENWRANNPQHEIDRDKRALRAINQIASSNNELLQGRSSFWRRLEGASQELIRNINEGRYGENHYWMLLREWNNEVQGEGQ